MSVILSFPNRWTAKCSQCNRNSVECPAFTPVNKCRMILSLNSKNTSKRSSIQLWRRCGSFPIFISSSGSIENAALTEFFTPIIDQKPTNDQTHTMFVANKMFAASSTNGKDDVPSPSTQQTHNSPRAQRVPTPSTVSCTVRLCAISRNMKTCCCRSTWATVLCAHTRTVFHATAANTCTRRSQSSCCGERGAHTRQQPVVRRRTQRNSNWLPPHSTAVSNETRSPLRQSFGVAHSIRCSRRSECSFSHSTNSSSASHSPHRETQPLS